MARISLPDAMQECAELPDAMQDSAERPDLHRRMKEDPATAFHRLRHDLAAAASGPTEKVDLRALLLDRGTEPA